MAGILSQMFNAPQLANMPQFQQVSAMSQGNAFAPMQFNGLGIQGQLPQFGQWQDPALRAPQNYAPQQTWHPQQPAPQAPVTSMSGVVSAANPTGATYFYGQGGSNQYEGYDYRRPAR